MDLLKDVKLKNVSRDFKEYCNTVKSEEENFLKELNQEGFVWNPSETLNQKVDFDGNLVPFYGDTTVVTLENSDISILENIQNDLYKYSGELFAEAINPKTFHITIHDLNNNIQLDSIKNNMKINEEKCKLVFKNLITYFDNNPDQSIVELKSAYCFPYNKSAIVMGFLPSTDKDFRIIMNTYNLFEEIVYLENWLRLHNTLCYFKPFTYSNEKMKILSNTISNINKNYSITIKLNLRKLAYQHFNDMNNYKDIFFVNDFI